MNLSLAILSVLDFTPNIVLILCGSLFTVLVSIAGVWSWVIWLGVSALLSIFHILFSCYQGFRIIGDLVALAILKFYIKIARFCVNIIDFSPQYKWRSQMRRAESYREWYLCAQCTDQAEGNLEWRETSADFPNSSKLASTTEHLRHCRETRDIKTLLFELPGIVKRNHLGIDNHELHNHCLTGTKRVIDEFLTEVENCLQFIADYTSDDNLLSLENKLSFFQKLSRNLGQTALCLSGGGSLSMYHMGVIRALIESGNYANVCK